MLIAYICIWMGLLVDKEKAHNILIKKLLYALWNSIIYNKKIHFIPPEFYSFFSQLMDFSFSLLKLSYHKSYAKLVELCENWKVFYKIYLYLLTILYK